MAAEARRRLNGLQQHQHMLLVCCSADCLSQLAARHRVHISPGASRRSVIRLSQYELSRLLTLVAAGIMKAAGRQLSEHVGKLCIDRCRQNAPVSCFMRNPIYEMFFFSLQVNFF